MLGDLGDLASAVALVAALRAGHLNRSRIAAQLDRSPAASVDLLLPLRHDPTPAVRFWGATLLARHAGDPRVAGELIAATGDEDDSVRAAAAEALAATRTRASERAVRALLADPAWFDRVHAVRTLQSYGRDAPLADVVPLLSDRSWWVRAAAKEALEARPRRATVLLRGQLEAPDRFARNGAAEVFQNTGVLDELLDAAPTNPAKRRLVERVLRAGGPGLAAAAAARQAADRGDREDLAVSA
jgi:HEAT repeat protein